MDLAHVIDREDDEFTGGYRVQVMSWFIRKVSRIEGSAQRSSTVYTGLRDKRSMNQNQPLSNSIGIKKCPKAVQE